MNVEIGAEAAQFPEKEYINGIAFAVRFIFISYRYTQRQTNICSICNFIDGKNAFIKRLRHRFLSEPGFNPLQDSQRQ